MNHWETVVVGGGAAGFFAAVNIHSSKSKNSVLILEKSLQLLTKVKISGGGRCNVTHSCFDPALLVKNYPRGEKCLRGPFSRFQPKDTIDWFAKRGVELHIEEDGRMFPTSNNSQTIIDCLLREADRNCITIKTGISVNEIEKVEDMFTLSTSQGHFTCNHVVIASGSHPKGHSIAKHFGHHIVSPVPSLFTFNIPESPLLDLSGISVNHVSVQIECSTHKLAGSILLTHWGFSGPAILKLSAWAARDLHECHYKSTLIVNWTGNLTVDQIRAELSAHKEKYGSRMVYSDPLFTLPKQLWARFLKSIDLTENSRWTNLSHQFLTQFAMKLHHDRYSVDGKTTYKREFVTAGGVSLDQINFRTMESKFCSNLYFIGEVLDVDGVTGGFNFQNAWTTSFIAASNISEKILVQDT